MVNESIQGPIQKAVLCLDMLLFFPVISIKTNLEISRSADQSTDTTINPDVVYKNVICQIKQKDMIDETCR